MSPSVTLVALSLLFHKILIERKDVPYLPHSPPSYLQAPLVQVQRSDCSQIRFLGHGARYLGHDRPGGARQHGEHQGCPAPRTHFADRLPAQPGIRLRRVRQVPDAGHAKGAAAVLRKVLRQVVRPCGLTWKEGS